MARTYPRIGTIGVLLITCHAENGYVCYIMDVSVLFLKTKVNIAITVSIDVSDHICRMTWACGMIRIQLGHSLFV